MAAAALTDGGNDKKVDFFFIDPATKYAAIVQGFTSRQWGKASADGNKATDLISAAGWLFAGDLKNVPKKLREIAAELHDAIQAKEINRIEFLYIHNCHESSNIQEELDTAVMTAAKLVADDGIAIAAHELGVESLDDLCLAAESQIFVKEKINIPLGNIINETGEVWQSIVASVDGSWLHGLHQKHGPRLFRGNYRDFLGIRNSVRNINKGIKSSVQTDADNFWTYNNGITALVRNISKKKSARSYEIEDISIINGAQTTGSIGECAGNEASHVKILCRFVKCSDKEILDKIIKFNNTQNAFRSSDQRSNDSIQRQLKADLEKYSMSYMPRRTGIPTSRGAITADGIAPLLCAFHGDPQTAARRRNDIFEVDSIYTRVFPSCCSGEHIVLVNCIGAAIDDVKLDLKTRVASDKATTNESKSYEVLQTSTAKLFLLAIIGAVAEEIAGEKIPDSYSWRYTEAVMRKSNEKRIFPWKEVVRAILPLVSAVIGEDAYKATRDFSNVKKVASHVASVINASGDNVSNRFAPVRDITEW